MVNLSHVPTADHIDRERQVLELRRAGMTFDEIATRVDYADRGSAHKAYKRGLARTLQQPAAELRELEGDRLDRLQVAIWSRALRGDLPALDRVLRISERRSKLFGLDQQGGPAEELFHIDVGQARMVAAGVAAGLDAIEATPEQRQVFTRVLLERMRTADADDLDDPADAPQPVDEPVDEPVVVPGVVSP